MQHDRVDVQVVATKGAIHFFDAHELEKEHGGKVKVWTDQDEWAVRPTSSSLSRSRRTRLTHPCATLQGWQKIGDPVLHIEVRS